MSSNDLQEKEDDAVLANTAADFSPAEQDEFDQLSENEIPFRKEEGKKKGFWTPRKKGAGIVSIALVSGGLGVWALIGPGMTVNHLRALLLEKVAQVQVDGSRRYRRKKFSKLTDAFSIEGRRGGKVIVEMERNGYKFSFDPKDKTKIVGITLPGGKTSIPNFDNGVLADHIEGYIEVHHPLRTSRWKTKRMEAFYGRYKISRQSITARSDTNVEDPERTVNKDIAGEVAGEEADTRAGGTDKAPEGETKEDEAKRKTNDERRRGFAEGDGTLDSVQQKIRDGVPIDELTEDEQAILRITSHLDDDVLEIIQKSVTSSSFGGKALTTLKGLGAADILDKVCTAKNRVRAISFAARNYRVLSLIRYTGTFVKAGDGIRTGNTDPKLLRELMKRTTEIDANGNSIGGSPGFAYLMKGKFSRSKNDVARSNVSIDGKLTGVPRAFEQATDNIMGTSQAQCKVYQNPAFQVGAAVIEIGAAIFGGGSTKVATVGAKEGFVVILKQGLKEALTKQAAKEFALQAAKGIAIDLTFDGALGVLQFYAEKSAKVNFTGQETGGELGDILGAGSGALNKQRSLQAGLVPATVTQYAAAQQQYFAEQREEQANQSLFAKVLDYNNQDSVAFNTMSQLAIAPAGVDGVRVGLENTVSHAASIFTRPLSLFGGLTSSASAQSEDEISYEELPAGGDTLATDPAGNFLPIMRQDILDIDPVENEASLVASGDIDPQSKEPIGKFKEHVKNCVESPDSISTLEHADQSKPENDCLAKQQTTVKYKAHLAWLDMQDGVDASLFPEEIGDQASSTDQGGPVDTSVPSMTVADCAAGTTDAGVADGYQGGTKYRIRLCEIPGFVSHSAEDERGLVRVNATASNKWLTVFKQTQAAGITISAKSSFRTMAKQEYFWGCYQSGNCNGGNVAARPGTSNHQAGFAVDIDIVPGKDPSLTSCKANPDAYPVYKLLVGIAPANGIDAKVASECWHWSVGGN